MNTMLKTLVVASLVASGAVHAEDAAPSDHKVTGYVGVVSQYILRGITETYNPTYDNSGPEADGPAVQGSIDYSHSSGFYAGYWFSSLGYSYADLDPAATKAHKNSVEHDLYAGYNGKAGEIGYTVGGTLYYYDPGWESTGFETKLGMTYGPFALTAQTLLNDVTFGNKGDTYYVASYGQPLPMDFSFSGKLGFYTYKKDGKFIPEIAESKSSAFRHLSLGVTKPLAATSATWGVEYIIGGDNRFGVAQADTLVGSLSLAF